MTRFPLRCSLLSIQQINNTITNNSYALRLHSWTSQMCSQITWYSL